MIESPATCKIIRALVIEELTFTKSLVLASIYRNVILNKSCFSKEQCRLVAGRQEWESWLEGQDREEQGS